MVGSDTTKIGEDRATELEPVITVDQLTKKYGEFTAVDNISFDIDRGTVVGLLGPNGAGKTTTIKSMVGTIVPDSGEVMANGTTVHSNSKSVHEDVGMMFEGSRNAYWRLTVRENLEFFTRLNGVPASERRERHDEILSRLGLLENADDPVRELSRGMKQKVALASTLSQDVEIVFLDEPTLGLDVETSRTLRRELRTLVDSQNLTVILTSHDMDVIEELCDRVILLSEGEIVADDSVENILNTYRDACYRVVIRDAIHAEVLEEVRSALPVVSTSEVSQGVELLIERQQEELLDIAQTLSSFEVEVSTLEIKKPDLEEVFLQIVDDSEAQNA